MSHTNGGMTFDIFFYFRCIFVVVVVVERFHSTSDLYATISLSPLRRKNTALKRNRLANFLSPKIN